MTPKRILVANRGEIAMRIIRAIRELGHVPLAIYSNADRLSMHVNRADMALCVGEGPSVHSYLDIERVLDAAKKMRADAIHPGYGFLSEKPEFSDAVKAAGMIFVGPSGDVIGKMGDKVQGRQTMESVGLSPIPGTKDAITDENVALQKAKEIGYPLMIKALAGGGGRGMRLVQKEEDFLNLFRRAHSESSKAFGDGRLYLERFVSSPHHVEVQVIADHHGNVRHLFERECSVQRRHQKVIEECSSPFVTEATRAKICDAAVKAVRDIGYANAGTIEFLMDDQQNFYFMEMNTRLQVEHPVTEWVTGIDIVKEQIRIALGEKISFTQEEVQRNGHSIEFRINAEDPERFLPQSGRLTGATFPYGNGVRVDTHVYRGYDIPVFYDSMIAKVSVWARNRMECINRSRAVLRETQLNGIKTNLPFHLQVLDNEVFQSGNYTTKFVGTDFNYVPREPSSEEMKMAVVASAFSAYCKEFKDGTLFEDDRSNWKMLGRGEALR